MLRHAGLLRSDDHGRPEPRADAAAEPLQQRQQRVERDLDDVPAQRLRLLRPGRHLLAPAPAGRRLPAAGEVPAGARAARVRRGPQGALARLPHRRRAAPAARGPRRLRPHPLPAALEAPGLRHVGLQRHGARARLHGRGRHARPGGLRQVHDGQPEVRVAAALGALHLHLAPRALRGAPVGERGQALHAAPAPLPHAGRRRRWPAAALLRRRRARAREAAVRRGAEALLFPPHGRRRRALRGRLPRLPGSGEDARGARPRGARARDAREPAEAGLALPEPRLAAGSSPGCGPSRARTATRRRGI